MNNLSISGTVKTSDGAVRSFSIRENATSIVLILKSDQGVIGSLAVQYDESGEAYIRLRRESGTDIVVSGFTQFRLSDFGKSTRRCENENL